MTVVTSDHLSQGFMELLLLRRYDQLTAGALLLRENYFMKYAFCQ
jgi:hypothetical protein